MECTKSGKGPRDEGLKALRMSLLGVPAGRGAAGMPNSLGFWVEKLGFGVPVGRGAAGMPNSFLSGRFVLDSGDS